MAVSTIYNTKKEIIGYRGYSHRGGLEFKIGDTLFNENWKMPKTHKDYAKYKKKADKSEFCNTVEGVIPFNMRGSSKCKTLSDCKKAATNFGNYIS
jgi:hypothetical protein